MVLLCCIDMFVYLSLFVNLPAYYYPFERGMRGPLLGVPAPAGLPRPELEARGPAGPDGRMASPGAPGTKDAGLMKVSRVRTKFPETWLWTETVAGYGTSVSGSQ